MSSLLTVSSINAANLYKSDGTSSFYTVSQVPYWSRIAALITWHSSYNGTTQLLGNIPDSTDSSVFAIDILQYYVHKSSVGGGGNDHGYLEGFVHQTGKLNTSTIGTRFAASGTTGFSLDGENAMYISSINYNNYYNSNHDRVTIPWDPNGTQSLSIYVTSAFNPGNVSNYFDYWYAGNHRQVA